MTDEQPAGDAMSEAEVERVRYALRLPGIEGVGRLLIDDVPRLLATLDAARRELAAERARREAAEAWTTGHRWLAAKGTPAPGAEPPAPGA